MRFGLIANLERNGADKAIDQFLDWAKKENQEVTLAKSLKKIVTDSYQFVPDEKLPEYSDVIVSMGGDGTLLSTARAVGKHATPLLGVNLGSLGFLTQISLQQMIPCLVRILKENYDVEERMVLQAHVNDEKNSMYAVNEVVVDNGPVSRMIEIGLSVNREDILTYRCDGLIIATPTGSTGYSVAVGGPIIHPSMQAIIASPISAFSLSTRPMILRPSDQVELLVGEQFEAARLTVDGQISHELEGGDKVRIKKAAFVHRFIVFPENTFYKVCRKKLHWGVAPSGEDD